MPSLHDYKRKLQYYLGKTLSKMLPRQDECRPRLCLGKDDVGCGNIDAWRPCADNAANGSILSSGTVTTTSSLIRLSGVPMRLKTD